jgi:hypothetical protein
MDIQLLSRWFNLGFSSREMATFLLLDDIRMNTAVSHGPEAIQKRWTELHEEVCKLVYTK